MPGHRKRGANIRIALKAFFSQEGQIRAYGQARCGRLKVDRVGGRCNIGRPARRAIQGTVTRECGRLECIFRSGDPAGFPCIGVIDIVNTQIQIYKPLEVVT